MLPRTVDEKTGKPLKGFEVRQYQVCWVDAGATTYMDAANAKQAARKATCHWGLPDMTVIQVTSPTGRSKTIWLTDANVTGKRSMHILNVTDHMDWVDQEEI